jgi:RES domain-containing protein
LTIEGAVAEAAQGFAGKLEPLTICLYEVDCADIVDLSNEEGRSEAGVHLEEMACEWAQDRAEGRIPPSWRAAERLIARGSAGALVPSFALNAPDKATNLVLWTWESQLPHRVIVHDPAGRLPRNPHSWRD